MTAHRRPRHRVGGQTTAELAVALPVLFLLALLLVQIALVLRDDLAVTHAAREAARAASVDPAPARAEAAAEAVLPGATVRIEGHRRVGALLAVVVTYHSPTTLPLVGPLLPDPPLSARAVMRVER